MSWPPRQLMRPFATALLLAVAVPHLCVAYSIHGQLTNEVQNGISIARTYDSLNRPTGYSLHEEETLRTSRTLREVNYSYDTFGRFSGVVFNVEAQKGRVDSTFSLLEYAPHIHSIRLICPPSSFTTLIFQGLHLIQVEL